LGIPAAEPSDHLSLYAKSIPEIFALKWSVIGYTSEEVIYSVVSCAGETKHVFDAALSRPPPALSWLFVLQENGKLTFPMLKTAFSLCLL